MLAPMKYSPVDVAMPPPKFGAPVSVKSAVTGQLASSSNVPKGICHFTAPLFRSTAVSVPQGAGLQGAPRNELSPVRTST